MGKKNSPLNVIISIIPTSKTENNKVLNESQLDLLVARLLCDLNHWEYHHLAAKSSIAILKDEPEQH